MRERCRVFCVTRASNRYWLTVGQGLLFLQQLSSFLYDSFKYLVFHEEFEYIFPCGAVILGHSLNTDWFH